MNYIIVNSTDFENFMSTARILQRQGYDLSASYIAKFLDPVQAASGEWGCLRSSREFPSTAIYTAPDVEYRFSQAANAWLADGQMTEYSGFVGNLYNYFLEAKWGDL